MSNNKAEEVFRNDLARFKKRGSCSALTQVGKEVSGFKCNNKE